MNAPKIEVVKFTSYEYHNAMAVFTTKENEMPEGVSHFNRILVLVPTETGGPRYEPLTDKEREGLDKAAKEDLPELGRYTRRAHFHDAILSITGVGVSRFKHPNDLVIYVTDDEPNITDGPHPAKSVVEQAFGKGYLQNTATIDMNPDTAGVTLMLVGAGLGLTPEDMTGDQDVFLNKLLGKVAEKAVEEGLIGGTGEVTIGNPDTDESAIVAKTTFSGAKFGLVREGGKGMDVFATMRIMHEPGTKPEYHKLTDEEREEFNRITNGEFVPVAAYTFKVGGYVAPTENKEGVLFQVGTLPIMVDSDGASIIEGFAWAPKAPFDKAGVTRYLTVKVGQPTKEELAEVARMKANSVWHEGKAATLN